MPSSADASGAAFDSGDAVLDFGKPFVFDESERRLGASRRPMSDSFTFQAGYFSGTLAATWFS